MEVGQLSVAAKETIINHLDRLLTSRDYPKTICPSEVARSMSAEELREAEAPHWRDLMPVVRSLVWERKQRGLVQVLQHGEPLGESVALEDIRGPIRVRIVPGS